MPLKAYGTCIWHHFSAQAANLCPTKLIVLSPAPVAVQHAFRSNENLFEYKGRKYAWNYWVFLGSTLKLIDVETQEELAVVQLRPTWTIQIITSWSWRYGCNALCCTVAFICPPIEVARL